MQLSSWFHGREVNNFLTFKDTVVLVHDYVCIYFFQPTTHTESRLKNRAKYLNVKSFFFSDVNCKKPKLTKFMSEISLPIAR
jgi:hypothetical protein